MGTAPVGAKGVFYVYLGTRWPAVADSGSNETVGREANGKGVAGTHVTMI